MRRWTLFALGLAASLAVTVALWAAGVPGFFLFLAFPFLFLPRWSRAGSAALPRRSGGACPACGSPREAGHRFCPSCGARMD